MIFVMEELNGIQNRTYEAIAALSVKIQPPTGQPRQKIGYKTSADEKK